MSRDKSVKLSSAHIFVLDSYCMACRYSEVNDPWLHFGYKNFEDVMESMKYVDHVYEMRIKSTYYHKKASSLP